MFLLLNGSIAIGFIIYFGIWMLGKTVTGRITSPFESNNITVAYIVNGKQYKATYPRHDMDYFERMVEVRYLTWAPSSSRVNSYIGIAAEPIGWWIVFLIASSGVLLTNNVIFSKGTIFRIYKKFPWISMEEYFPVEQEYYQDSTRPRPGKTRRGWKQLGN